MTAKELAFVGSSWILTAGITYLGIKIYNDYTSNQLRLSDKVDDYISNSNANHEYDIVISLDDLKRLGGETKDEPIMPNPLYSNSSPDTVYCDAQCIDREQKEPTIRQTLKAFKKIIG